MYNAANEGATSKKAKSNILVEENTWTRVALLSKEAARSHVSRTQSDIVIHIQRKKTEQ